MPGIRCAICAPGRSGSNGCPRITPTAGPRRSTSTRPPTATSSRRRCPGIARDQIELALEDSRLTIRGQRVERTAASDVHYHQVERGHGAFSRTFEFADKIDVDGVTADLADGVLTVTLPKMPPRAAAQDRGPMNGTTP